MTASVNYSAFVGLDVHKESIAVAIASPERQGEVRFWGNINNDPEAVRRLFKRLMNHYPQLLVCYEAGPCGYLLYRQLSGMNIECLVAPSRIPKSPADRIKNDHRGAVALARLLRAGELTSVWVPDESHEVMRDLVRARSATRKDIKIAKQRIQSMLLRSGRKYEKKPWTRIHVLKQGCKVEELQLETVERLELALAIYAIVAWRLCHLMRLGRRMPELDAELYFEPEEWKVAYILWEKPQPRKPPQLNEVIRLIAVLGGFLGRKGNGEPGAKTLWRGLSQIRTFAAGMRYARKQWPSTGSYGDN